MSRSAPDRTQIINMVADYMYSGRVLNNAHRGELVEMMVLAALSDNWRHVGLGWHPWDLQRGAGLDRVRIQVKHTAALQLWGDTVNRTLTFGWKSNAPDYFKRDNPDEDIESEGWFCEIFVFGIHDELDRHLIDQADPAQWTFIVIPISDLRLNTNTMSLQKAVKRWKSVPWSRLEKEIEIQIGRL